MTGIAREAFARRFLMCPPSYFAVEYSINPWMDPHRPVDRALAEGQWEALRATLTGLGHRVDLVEPVPGLPDMVFAANGATVIGDRALIASFRHTQRAPEAAAYEKWFRDRGFAQVPGAAHMNEGQGDHLALAGLILAGTGFRTQPASLQETETYFGRPVVALELVDPRLYHLDTALAVLDDEQIMYWPGGFSAHSRHRLATLFPSAVQVQERDAQLLALNAVSDGRHVLLPVAATELAERLTGLGFEPVGVDMSEYAKAGGGPKCCALELLPGTPAPPG
ncbi:dimethylargininase [Kitasatospora sp. NPDC057223]|uniref:dimethylargininase n=1 Tax=Kitasatospora sp. NPDC057223 TaxID=3346055 RepID=UPI003629B336